MLRCRSVYVKYLGYQYGNCGQMDLVDRMKMNSNCKILKDNTLAWNIGSYTGEPRLFATKSPAPG